MSVVTGENIWNALQGHLDLQQIPVAVRLLWKELCTAAVPALELLADQPVTAASCTRAQHVVFGLMVENGRGQKLAESYPGASPTKVEEVVNEFVRIHQLLDQFVKEDIDVPAQLGITEEEFLACPGVGRLSRASLDRWRSGGFTIGDLLTTQPDAVFVI